MRLIQIVGRTAVTLIVLAGLTTAGAQTPAPQKPSSGSQRLFLSFAEDASVIQTQRWEGQAELVDSDAADAVIARGLVVLRPLEDVEVGAMVGFGSTDAPAGAPDGSGATDLDLWGKYSLGGGPDSEFAVGALFTIPTGDDTAGLGADSFGLEAFGSFRYGLGEAIVGGSVGVRINEDGRVQGVALNGNTAPFIAGSVIYPLADQVSVIGEARYEGERFDGMKSSTRILGGLDWRAFNRGTIRGALAIGLTDGAPDSQLIVGYAHDF